MQAPRITAVLAAPLARLDPGEVFARVDPERVTAAVEQPVMHAVNDITRDVLAEHQPGAWEALPPMVQELAIKQMQAAAPRTIRLLVQALREDARALIDLQRLALQRIGANPAYARRMRELVQPERTAMIRTGFACAVVLGLMTVVVGTLTAEPLVLLAVPLILAVSGWLAVRAAHRHFHRRRDEVGRQIGELIATEVLTPAVVASTLPGSDRALHLVAGVVDVAVDEQTRRYRPLVSSVLGQNSLDEMKRTAARKVLAQIPDASRAAHSYLTEAMGIAGRVADGVRDLPAKDYDRLLRSVLLMPR